MTKVRTILAEFCSPKEILAINRLGLIKNDDRDTQPVPWRHRLPNDERRRLVTSEMRTAIRTSYRVSPKDKEKAVSTARNVKDSKMGECLLNVQLREDPVLKPSLVRLGREQIKREHGLQQTKLLFLQQSQCLNREPIILVERAPSLNALMRADAVFQTGIDPDITRLPSHRRPLLSRCKTPSTLTSIEAFTAENKRKKNVWDEAVEETPKFRSIARPSVPLTSSEIAQLQTGHLLHKPRARITGDVAKTPKLTRSKTMTSSVFITQLPRDTLTTKSESMPDRSMRLRSEKTHVSFKDFPEEINNPIRI